MREWVLALLVFVLAGGKVIGDEDRKADEGAIRKNLADYVSAYRAKDAAKLASMWSETGRFFDPQSGEAVSGRKGIEAAYEAMFQGGGEVGLEAEIETIRFLTDDVAVEEGKVRVSSPGALATLSRYQAIHVKSGGKWLIDSVRETLIPAGEPGVPQLRELDWMVGDWVDAGEGSAVRLSCSWELGKSFLRRDFAVVVADRIEMDGIEVIGWDPAEKQLRSWVFDSGGGFGSAIWEKGEGGAWEKRMRGTAGDGKKAYAVHVVKSIDENTYEWSAHGRAMDGVPLPNIEPVKVIRVTGSER